MRRSHLIAALAMGAGALSVAACGGGETQSTGGAGGATASTTTTSTTTSSTATTTTTTTTTSSSSTTVTTTTGGTSCADGTEIVFGDYPQGDLANTGQADFYRFKGKKGQVVMLDVDAQVLDDAPYDPDHIDPVVTLFDAQGVQLAQNDNPLEFSTGDSRLYTILPADGDYCVRIADCWSVITNPASTCQSPKDKSFTAYGLYLFEFTDEQGDPNTGDVESGDTAASAQTADYVADNDGYYILTFWGTFRDEADVDVFSLTPPLDVDPPSGVRTTGRFTIMQSGNKQSGSTSATGRVWIAEAGAPDMALAAVQASKNPRFQPRMELDKEYLLFVSRPQGAVGTNDFYVIRHNPSWGNTLELELLSGDNDTVATAEPLAIDLGDGYIEGDITPGDVDYFVAAVPQGATEVSLSCGAQRYGSGLRGLKASLLKADGTSLGGGSIDVENETSFVSINDISVGSQTEVLLKLEANSQDPNVAQSFYICGIHFI